MANKYLQKLSDGKVYHDISTICEPKVHTATPGFGTASDSLFKGEGPFQNAGTNTENITLTGYEVNGTSCSAVRIGHYPVVTETCNNYFWCSKIPGDYTITRTNTSLTIGSTTFSKSDFKNGVIPAEVIIFAVGGGGGGGGSGWYVNEDKDLVRVPGGAGGGGGCIIARVDLTRYSKTTYVHVGGGGANGKNGSSSEVSSGTAGTDGDMSSFDNGYEYVFFANGGEGGNGGVGKEEDFSAGTGGTGGGGNVTLTNNADIGIYSWDNVIGGSGNDYNNQKKSGIKELTFNPYIGGTGSTAVTIVKAKNKNNGSQHNGSGGNVWYSGGSSFGYGAYYDGNFFNYANGVGGGGGSGNNLLCPGAAGAVFICYDSNPRKVIDEK